MDKAGEGGDVILMKTFTFETKGDYHGEDREADDFLDYSQLNQTERPAVDIRPYTVRRNL